VILYRKETFVTSYTGLFHAYAHKHHKSCLLLAGVTVIGRSYVQLKEMWEVYFKENIFMVEIQKGGNAY